MTHTDWDNARGAADLDGDASVGVVCAGRSVTDDLRFLIIVAASPGQNGQAARRLRGSGLDTELVVFQLRQDGAVRVAAHHGGTEPFQPGDLVFHRTWARYCLLRLRSSRHLRRRG